jgi:small nuclear ribonucleoprotein (snRNP)-like protein
MNIVVEEAMEVKEKQQNPLGTVVIRGNSITVMEALEKILLI